MVGGLLPVRALERHGLEPLASRILDHLVLDSRRPPFARAQGPPVALDPAPAATASAAEGFARRVRWMSWLERPT
jgi:hypothetical protein